MSVSLIEVEHDVYLAQEVQAAWAEEITARVAALKNGSATLFPAADVFAEARKACR